MFMQMSGHESKKANIYQSKSGIHNDETINHDDKTCSNSVVNKQQLFIGLITRFKTCFYFVERISKPLQCTICSVLYVALPELILIHCAVAIGQWEVWINFHLIGEYYRQFKNSFGPRQSF